MKQSNKTSFPSKLNFNGPCKQHLYTHQEKCTRLDTPPQTNTITPLLFLPLPVLFFPFLLPPHSCLVHVCAATKGWYLMSLSLSQLLGGGADHSLNLGLTNSVRPADQPVSASLALGSLAQCHHTQLFDTRARVQPYGLVLWWQSGTESFFQSVLNFLQNRLSVQNKCRAQDSILTSPRFSMYFLK